MAIVVVLPEPLVRLFPGSERRVSLEAQTVDEALAALNQRWPGMRDRVVDSAENLRPHIVVFVGEERAGLETATPDGCEVRVVPAISGG